LQALATEEDGRVKKQTYNIAQYVQALGQQQKALELAGQRAVLGVGRGDRQNALHSQLNAQQDRFAQQALDLENQRSDPSRNMSTEEFEQKSKALAGANKKATDQIRQNYADVQTAQGDWTNGATSAWENYLDSAKDVAGQTKTLFTNAFSNMEDAVANFALTGKLSFSDFTKSVISDLARIATRQATSGVLSTLFGIGATAAGSYSDGASTGSGASSGFDYSLGSASSGLSYGGGRATGGDVAPNSLYQVNEVGPELFNQGGKSYLMTGANGGSVTPLGSGAASVSAGAGGSSPIAVSIQISGDGTSQVSSNTSGMEQFGAEIGRFVEARYKQLEAKSLGPQGNIRKAINGRA
jgi:lambda family phage tail tape measure protein